MIAHVINFIFLFIFFIVPRSSIIRRNKSAPLGSSEPINNEILTEDMTKRREKGQYIYRIEHYPRDIKRFGMAVELPTSRWGESKHETTKISRLFLLSLGLLRGVEKKNYTSKMGIVLGTNFPNHFLGGWSQDPTYITLRESISWWNTPAVYTHHLNLRMIRANISFIMKPAPLPLISLRKAHPSASIWLDGFILFLCQWPISLSDFLEAVFKIGTRLVFSSSFQDDEGPMATGDGIFQGHRLLPCFFLGIALQGIHYIGNSIARYRNSTATAA